MHGGAYASTHHHGADTGAECHAHTDSDSDLTRLCGIVVIVWGELQEDVRHLCVEAGQWSGVPA